MTARYPREWARFVDWCASAGRDWLPAAEEDVVAYLAEEEPPAGTAGRWVAAIREAHRDAGLADPCRGAVRGWLRRAREGEPVQLEGVLEELREPVRLMPTTGWPGGVFGRRDRLAFLLHRLGPVSARALVRLSTEDVAMIEPHAVAVSTGGTVTTVRALLADPMLCPACAARQWLWVMQHAAVFARRALAERISAAQPDAGHICELGSPSTLGEELGQWPLLPAVDRWGYFAMPPVPAMSLRALEEALRTAGQRRLTAPVPRLARPEDRQPAEPVTSPDMTTAARRKREKRHRAGVAARARAQAELAGVMEQLDELDAEADELASRVRQVLDESTGGI